MCFSLCVSVMCIVHSVANSTFDFPFFEAEVIKVFTHCVHCARCGTHSFTLLSQYVFYATVFINRGGKIWNKTHLKCILMKNKSMRSLASIHSEKGNCFYGCEKSNDCIRKWKDHALKLYKCVYALHVARWSKNTS